MTHRITNVDELERLYGQPPERSLIKETPRITEPYRRLIEAAPFLAVASVGPEGMDCSPRGDAAGFVRILDDRTVAIPDRRGNNRIDTLRNIVRDGRLALLFLIPGLDETLRINGRAHISTAPDLLESFEVDGKQPQTVIIVAIETMYFQCARALKRSRLWDPAYHRDPKTLPTAGELVKSVVETFDAATYDTELPGRQARTLY